MNKRITDYKLLEYSSAKALSMAVCDLLDGGWEPYGSPFSGEEGVLLCQAMVIREDETPE